MVNNQTLMRKKALDDAKANEQAASDAVNNATADKAATEKADSDR